MNEPRYVYFERYGYHRQEHRYVFDTPFYVHDSVQFRLVFDWLEEYVAPAGEGCGWSATLEGDTVYIENDNHAMAFRLRWC